MPDRYEEQRRERDRARAQQEREREEAERLDDYYGDTGGSGYVGGVSDFDDAMADVPVLGWLFGSQARRDAEEARRSQAEMQNVWDRLGGSAPSELDLTPEYSLEGSVDEYGDLLGDPSRMEGVIGGMRDQRAALDALRGIIDAGGYTDADRAVQQAQRAQQAQWLGSQNRAALQQAEARGMGGGGQELAARLAAGQAANTANVMGDASIQQAAMQRALGAIQSQGQLGGQLAGLDMARRRALDAYNQSNMDWRRGRETRNTAWANRQSDAETQARQTAYQNRERAAAGKTNQYNAGAGERMFGQQRQDEANAAGAGIIGSVLDEVL